MGGRLGLECVCVEGGWGRARWSRTGGEGEGKVVGCRRLGQGKMVKDKR